MGVKNIHRALFFTLLYSICTVQTQGKYIIIAWIHIPRDVSHCICILYVSQPLDYLLPRDFCFPIAYGWLDYIVRYEAPSVFPT